MIIAFDATFSLGSYRGMGRYLRLLVAALPHQFVGFARPQPGNREEPTFDNACVRFAGSGPYFWWEQRWLPKLSSQCGAAVLLCPYNTGPVFVGSPALLVVVHDVIFLKSTIGLLCSRMSFRQLLGATYRKLVFRRVIERAAAIITVSSASRTEILRRMPEVSPKLFLIPNSVSDDWFSSPLRPHETAPSDATRGEPPRYVFTVSGSAPSKNLAMLIRAMQTLEGLHLRVAGLKSHELSRFQAIACVARVEDRIIFLGRLDDVELRQHYNGASAFVFASLEEGFGIPLVEALACGVPCACSDIPVFHEIAGEAACFFDPTLTNRLRRR